MRSREEIKGFLKQMQRFNGTMVERALKFAEFAHDGQVDKAGQDYIQHPMRVAQKTSMLYDNNPYLVAIAYMHDVVEDGNFTVSDLSAFFPKVVWDTVEILTRRKSEDRKEYIKSIGNNFFAIQVKIADLEDNMDLCRISFPTEKDYERQSRYIDEYKYLKERLENLNSTLAVYEKNPETYCESYT